MKEIGSEYWICNKNSFDSNIYLLSGRTAIDVALQDILNYKDVGNVYLPAWCCDSMLQPFLDRSIDVCFYDMSYGDGHLFYEIDNDYHTDILYFTNYFGYHNTLSSEIIRSFKEQGSVIIYDQTHSLFQEDDQYVDLADYTFASIRKWVGVPCGAYLSKNNGPMTRPLLHDYPYISEKIDAMRLKADYIEGRKSIPKQSFLDKYNSFNHHLAECYRDYRIDDLSLFLWDNTDKNTIKSRRQLNSVYLQTYLQDISQIQLMFQAMSDDCCLFVPILFNSEKERNRVRHYLTSHSIYCPVHWPKPSLIKDFMHVNNLYSCELSLICDQRYDVKDMSRILETLIDAIENK